jgi:hypothetical protein
LFGSGQFFKTVDFDDGNFNNEHSFASQSDATADAKSSIRNLDWRIRFVLATLSALVWQKLKSRGAGLSDEEILERDADLDAGRLVEISHEEFVRQVENERRR